MVFFEFRAQPTVLLECPHSLTNRFQIETRLTHATTAARRTNVSLTGVQMAAITHVIGVRSAMPAESKRRPIFRVSPGFKVCPDSICPFSISHLESKMQHFHFPSSPHYTIEQALHTPLLHLFQLRSPVELRPVKVGQFYTFFIFTG